MQSVLPPSMLDAIERRLNERPRRRFTLKVVPDATQQEGDWWYVVVVPEPGDVRSSEYAHELAAVEETLRDDDGLQVLLVPTLADD